MDEFQEATLHFYCQNIKRSCCKIDESSMEQQLHFFVQKTENGLRKVRNPRYNEIWLITKFPNDDSVRLHSHELEVLDYSLLYQTYSVRDRNPAMVPKTMFNILTYVYSQNIYSARKIEIACIRDINFMWLIAGQNACETFFIRKSAVWNKAEKCQKKPYSLTGQSWRSVRINIPLS